MHLTVLSVAAAISFSAGVGPAHPQGDALDLLLDRLVADQDSIALQEPDGLYSYYEIDAFDVASFDAPRAIDRLQDELPNNRFLDCTFAAYPSGEFARLGLIRFLTGAGQAVEAARIDELPADRLVGTVMRSSEGYTGDIVDCDVTLARLYFDSGQVLTVYLDGRQDLAERGPNVPSVVRLTPLEEFRNDRVSARPLPR
jgi:hypothetical protein